MPKLSPHFAFLALALWLLGNWAGAHGHFCFDGQEPPVSVHMDVMDGHLEHHGNEVHQDADIELDQTLLAKLGKIELGLILFAAALLLLILPKPVFTCIYHPFYPRISLHRRPLLRAPPLPV
jgi:hypothetical protein